MKKCWLWLLAAAMGTVSNAFAGGGSSGTSSLFLLGAGARAVGMGGSFVSIADDASAVFWNPAGLARLSLPELDFSHVTLPEGSGFDFAGMAYPTVRAGVFAAGFLRVGTDGIFSRDTRAVDLGTVDYSENQFLLGYGHPLFKFLNVGGTFKFYNQSLAGFSANAVGADFGILAGPYHGIFLGLNAQDFVASDLKLINSKESIPRNFKAGLSYLLPSRPAGLGLRLAVDAEKTENTPVAWHAGAELVCLDYFFLRGGYDRENPTFGLGFVYHRFGLDYAYKRQPEGLGSSHRFGFSFRFGRSVGEREKSARERKQKEMRESFLSANRARLENYRQQAERFAGAGQSDSALAYVRLALGIDPDNESLKNEAVRLENLLRTEEENREQAVLDTRLREEALQSAQREYSAGHFKRALGFLEERARAGDTELVRLSTRVQTSLDSAKKSLDSAAWAAFREKRFEDALAAWEKMSSLDPADSSASNRFQLVAQEIKISDLTKQGIADFEAGRLFSAGENFRKVLQLRPGEPVATAYLQKIRSTTEAPTTLADLQKDPEAWRQYNEGLGAYAGQDYRRALEIWQGLLSRYPNNEALLRNVADAKKRLK